MRIEGNNGGDYIDIEPIKGNVIKLEVGHSCGVYLRLIVPVEFMTLAIAKVMDDFGGVEDFIQSSSWPVDFKNSLISQIDSAPSFSVGRKRHAQEKT